MPLNEINIQLHDLYHDDCCGKIAFPNLADVDDLTRQLATMVQQIWKDKGLPAGTINSDVTSSFAKKLWSGTVGGYGNDFLSVDYDTADIKMLAMLQKNVWQFSGAKNYQQLRELTTALLAEDGKLRSYDQFKEAVLKINDKYEKRWLKAEYDLAVAGGQMAGKWVTIKEQQATFPLLQFDAVLDTQTTALCKSLHGTILPVGHAFWNRFYPPNHFGCRSTVRQLRTGVATAEKKIPTADIPAMFQTNLGKSGLIFPKDHAYFIDIPDKILKGSMNALRKQAAGEIKYRLKGKVISVENFGDVAISSNGIDKMVRDRYDLAYVSDQLLKNSKIINDRYLNVADEDGYPFKYDYLSVKGIDDFLVIRRADGDKIKYLYDIVSKLHK